MVTIKSYFKIVIRNIHFIKSVSKIRWRLRRFVLSGKTNSRWNRLHLNLRVEFRVRIIFRGLALTNSIDIVAQPKTKIFAKPVTNPSEHSGAHCGRLGPLDRQRLLQVLLSSHHSCQKWNKVEFRSLPGLFHPPDPTATQADNCDLDTM